jgi:hypothetical protein
MSRGAGFVFNSAIVITALALVVMVPLLPMH